MNMLMRTYYFAVLGGIGGLIGWKISDILGLSFFQNIYMSEAVVGTLIGLMIGLMIGLSEGLILGNFVEAGKSGLTSSLLGAAGGAIGLPIGEFIFQNLGGAWVGRILGWCIFGSLVGLAEGIFGKSQAWKGTLGGFIGGWIGGLLLQGAHTLLKDPIIGNVLGLILLGTSIGAFISLITVLLSRVWFEVMNGKLKGTEFILDKFLKQNGPAIAIGSSALKSEIVMPDPDIAPQHAMLTSDGTKFSIKDISLNGTFVNNKRIERSTLKDGERIRMGNTELVYHEKRSS
ncbi:MAG: FHA domain-containing protein [Chloroflexota bacterium]